MLCVLVIVRVREGGLTLWDKPLGSAPPIQAVLMGSVKANRKINRIG